MLQTSVELDLCSTAKELLYYETHLLFWTYSNMCAYIQVQFCIFCDILFSVFTFDSPKNMFATYFEFSYSEASRQ